VGSYYGLVYTWFDLTQRVCFDLLVVFMVGWVCFSFKVGFHVGFLISGFQAHFRISFRFLPIVLSGGFSVGQGPRALAWRWREEQ